MGEVGVWIGDAYCLLGVMGVMGGDVVSMVLCEESSRRLCSCATRHMQRFQEMLALPRSARAKHVVFQPG